MRYSRMKRGRNQRRYAGIMVIVLLIVVGIYFLTAGTVGKYISNIIGPILRSNQDHEGPADLAEENGGKVSDDEEITEFNLPSQEDESEKGPKIKETLQVEAIDFTLIQVGAFNNDENAKSIAEDFVNRGGAGYIIDDQYLRVIAMAFHDRGSAEEVQEGLKGQSVEAQLYEIQCPGIDMEITARREKIEGIKGAFDVLKSSLTQMESLIKDLDNDKITGEMAIKRLDEIRAEMVSKGEELERYSPNEEGSSVLKGLMDLLMHQSKSMGEIVQENISNKVAISAKIKYTYIDIIIGYKTYIEGISKS